MANALSKTFQDAFLNWFKNTDFPASQANLWIALYITDPDDSDTPGTEVSGGTYARVAIPATDWSAISGDEPSQISNSAVVDFGTTLPACTLHGFAIMTASTAGDEVLYQKFPSTININAGDPTSFAIGALVIQVGNP
jgi:hypothetical protein